MQTKAELLLSLSLLVLAPSTVTASSHVAQTKTLAEIMTELEQLKTDLAHLNARRQGIMKEYETFEQSLAQLNAPTNRMKEIDTYYAGLEKQLFQTFGTLLVACPVLVHSLFGLSSAFEKCKNFQPTVPELNNVRTQKKLAKKLAINRVRQADLKKFTREVSNIAQHSPDGRKVGKQVLIERVIPILLGPPKSIKDIPESDINITNNDFPRYRKLKYTGMFFGVTGLLAGIVSTYQIAKFANYPSLDQD